MQWSAIICCLAVGLCTQEFVLAQVSQPRPDLVNPTTASASLEGRVVDERGKPVSMARIVLTPFRAAIGQTTYTDDDGRFVFYNLRAGNYHVSASAAGFATVTQNVDLMGDAQMIQLVVNRNTGPPTDSSARSVPVSELAIPEKARELYRKAVKELERRKYNKSIEHFQAAIRQYPDYASAYSGMGIVYIQMRQPTLAQAAFEKALLLNPQSAEAHLGMGLTCNDQQMFAEAEKHLLKAQQLTPMDWHVHYELGRAYYGMDQLEQAEKSLRVARQARPDYGNLYLLLANVLVLQSKYAEGLAEMKEFLRVAPDSPLAAQVREKIKLLKAELGQP